MQRWRPWVAAAALLRLSVVVASPLYAASPGLWAPPSIVGGPQAAAVQRQPWQQPERPQNAGQELQLDAREAPQAPHVKAGPLQGFGTGFQEPAVVNQTLQVLIHEVRRLRSSLANASIAVARLNAKVFAPRAPAAAAAAAPSPSQPAPAPAPEPMVFGISAEGGSRCSDTDGEAVDRFQAPCAKYSQHPEWCGTADDSDFASGRMCCACKGGNLQVLYAQGKELLASSDEQPAIGPANVAARGHRPRALRVAKAPRRQQRQHRLKRRARRRLKSGATGAAAPLAGPLAARAQGNPRSAAEVEALAEAAEAQGEVPGAEATDEADSTQPIEAEAPTAPKRRPRLRPRLRPRGGYAPARVEEPEEAPGANGGGFGDATWRGDAQGAAQDEQEQDEEEAAEATGSGLADGQPGAEDTAD